MVLYSGTTQEHYCFHDRISLYEHSSNLTLKWYMFQLPTLVSHGWIKTRWFIDTSIWLRGKLRNILLDLNIRVVSCVGPDVDPAPRPRLLAPRQQHRLADIEPPRSRHHRGRHAGAGGEQLGDPDNKWWQMCWHLQTINVNGKVMIAIIYVAFILFLYP